MAQAHSPVTRTLLGAIAIVILGAEAPGQLRRAPLEEFAGSHVVTFEDEGFRPYQNLPLPHTFSGDVVTLTAASHRVSCWPKGYWVIWCHFICPRSPELAIGSLTRTERGEFHLAFRAARGFGGFFTALNSRVSFRVYGLDNREIGTIHYDWPLSDQMSWMGFTSTEAIGNITILGEYVAMDDLHVLPVDCLVGTVNAGQGSVADVLFLNGTSGSGSGREVEYGVLNPFEFRVILPPAVPPNEFAPFALYVWTGSPTPSTVRGLPYRIGCSAMPMPLSIGPAQPRPVITWSNAGRFSRLGAPDRDSCPAPTVLVRRPRGVRHPARVVIQGIIYDPGSAAEVPASVTNGIVAVPVVE